MGQELKDLLKPPFGIIENDDDGTIIVDKNGFLQGLGEHYRMNFDQWKEFTDFITAALNEKWELDFSEPLRWKVNNTTEDDFDCPKCGTGFYMATRFQDYKFCPNCGQKLLPPKEE